MRMAIKGIGVVGGFGTGVASLEAALREGAVTVGELEVPTSQGAVRVPAYRADTSELDRFVPKRALRRVDRYSKLGLLGAHLALEDAGLLGSDLSRLGVVVASGYGATATTFAFLDSLIDDGDICASPTHFANSVHNSAAANISITLGIKGPSLTVSQFDMSVASALVSARQWLAEGRVDAVLFGAIDELSDLVGYLQHRRCGAEHAGAMAPLDTESESSIVGEGAAFLVLTRADGERAYCGIDAVETGSIYGAGLILPPDAVLLLGADGRKELGARYQATVPADAGVVCYTHIYGTMPAAAAFDLAAAALVLKNGSIFPIPGAAGCTMQGTPAALGVSQLCSLRLAGAHEYAVVTMSAL